MPERRVPDLNVACSAGSETLQNTGGGGGGGGGVGGGVFSQVVSARAVTVHRWLLDPPVIQQKSYEPWGHRKLTDWTPGMPFASSAVATFSELPLAQHPWPWVMPNVSPPWTQEMP